MRILTGFLLVAAASVILSPSSQDLHNRYGEPDMERFIARPGIGVTVQFGSDQLACQVLIGPPQTLIHQEEQAPLMSSDGVSDVLEEIAPIATRGREVFTAISETGRNESRFAEYENVTIIRSKDTGAPSSHDQDVRTTITFKRDICPKMQSQFNRLQ
jgi:hypothetical protein